MKIVQATKRGRAPAVLLVVALTTLLVAGPAAADVESVGGGAFGESVDVTVASAHITSGPLPAVTLPAGGGGPFTSSALGATVPGLLQTGLLTVRTQGATGPNGFSASSAEVAGANLVNGLVTATAVRSECRAGTRQPTGKTVLFGANAAGIPVAVEPEPNTTIPLVVGTLILNEQQKTGVPGHSEITVNAIHLILDDPLGLGQGDIIIAQSRCETRGSNVI